MEAFKNSQLKIHSSENFLRLSIID